MLLQWHTAKNAFNYYYKVTSDSFDTRQMKPYLYQALVKEGESL